MKGQEYLIFGDSNGETFKWDSTVFADDTHPIAFRIKTKFYTLPTDSDAYANNIKLLERVQVFGEFGNGVVLSYAKKDLDGEGDYEILGEINNHSQTEDVYEKGNAFSLGFDDYSNYAVQIDGFKMYYKHLKDIY